MSKILFLASNPQPTSRLALDEEARDIEAKIRAADHRDALILQARWAVRFDDLLQALNQDRPVVVHFSGHGAGTRGIVLHNELGSAEPIPAGTLQRLFTTLKGDIRVIVLNACYSAEEARAISEVIDCVIGMSQPIGDRAACKFAASFYRALGFGRSVRNAFDQGVISIEGHGLPYPEAPQLFTRPGIDPDTIFIASHSVDASPPEMHERTNGSTTGVVEMLDEVTLEPFIRDQSRDLVVVLFVTGSSAPSRTALITIRELAPALPKWVKIGSMDVEGAEAVAARFRILHVPSALFVVKGKIKDRQIGNLSRIELLSLIGRYGRLV